MSMRIVKNGDVHVSAPIGMPREKVIAFIEEHKNWINEARKNTYERQKQRTAFFNKLPLATRDQTDEALKRLKALVEPMVEKHAREMSVQPSIVYYKPTISRWGQCNVKDRSICISAYVLLLPEWCVEHIVVHELCHLLEPSHNARFHFNHLGWYTANYHIVRNILRDNSACRYDGILANGDTWTDNGSNAYPRILFDGHLSEMEQVMSVVQVVINRCDLNLWANQDIVFYHHLTRRKYRCSFIDGHILADAHPASAITIERRNDSYTVI